MLALLAGTTAIAGATSQFEFLTEQRWFSGSNGFTSTVRVPNNSSLPAELSILYRYPDGTAGVAAATSDASKPNQFKFELPPKPDALPGEVVYRAEMKTSAGTVRSEDMRLALALEKELDITGDAAVALLYPIGGPEYTVRYVPCCNIFGGTTIATRLTVNPEDGDTGLPEKRLSDFIVLKPDGLSASTMGLYFDFKLGAKRFQGITPGLFEFDGKKWVEFKTYTIDPATGGISMHCPNGGTFVVAAKP
jgi:hypothetical protein